MDTIFMNSKNGKACNPHRLLLNLSNKINLKRSNKYIALSNLSMYYTLINIKKLYQNNKFKTSASTWNERFELSDGSCSVYKIPKIILSISLKNMKKWLIILRQEYI